MCEDEAELEVIYDVCHLNVNIGTSADLDCHAAIQFIQSGCSEIDDYVEKNIIPKLQSLTGG